MSKKPDLSVPDFTHPVTLPEAINSLWDGFGCDNYQLLNYRHSPEPFHPSDSSALQKSFCDLLNRNDLPAGPGGNNWLIIDDLFFRPVQQEFPHSTWVIAGKHDPSALKSDLSEKLQQFFRLAGLVCSTLKTESALAAQNSGNLIGQITHDINSLINLIAAVPDESDELKLRLLMTKKMIREVLFYAREHDLIVATVPVTELIQAVLANFSFDSNIELETSIQSSYSITADIELIDNAMAILFDNASRFALLGNKKISINVTDVSGVHHLYPNDWVNIEVRDGGPGIAKDFVPMLATPFFTTDKYSGHNGLNLANAKKIVETHHGLMEISAREGQGTVIIVYLPAGDNGSE